jgi:hypothetical protein
VKRSTRPQRVRELDRFLSEIERAPCVFHPNGFDGDPDCSDLLREYQDLWCWPCRARQVLGGCSFSSSDEGAKAEPQSALPLPLGVSRDDCASILAAGLVLVPDGAFHHELELEGAARWSATLERIRWPVPGWQLITSCAGRHIERNLDAALEVFRRRRAQAMRPLVIP